MAENYLKDADVGARYGAHRTWAWRRARLDPDFPKPIRLSPGCTRWRLSDIEAWEQRKAEAQ